VKRNFTHSNIEIKEGRKSGQESGVKFRVEVQKIMEIRRKIKTKNNKDKTTKK